MKKGDTRVATPLEKIVPGASWSIVLLRPPRPFVGSRPWPIVSRGPRPFLEHRRTDVAQGRVPAPRVVKRLQVFEQLTPGLLHCGKPIRELDLQPREEGFHHRIVVTIAGPTH